MSDGERLVDQPVGARVSVVGISEREDHVGQRLAALGLLPGTEVRVIRRAPLGDPTVYEFRGYQLCLRRGEARRVRVQAVVGGAA